MINLTHLTKRFGATVALDDVTFSVAPGTIVGFLGPNGAGKSTCLQRLRRLPLKAAPPAGRASRPACVPWLVSSAPTPGRPP